MFWLLPITFAFTQTRSSNVFLAKHVHGHALRNSSDSSEKEAWLEEPRDDFVPRCQQIVHVQYEDYLPLTAIDSVCEDVGNHAGCLAWKGKLVETFRAVSDAEAYGQWCGGFYDWFHERFGDRCATQCEKLACKPFCAHHEDVVKLEKEDTELFLRSQALEEAQAEVDALQRDLEDRTYDVKNANQTLERAITEINRTNDLSDAEGRKYNDAVAKSYSRTEQLANMSSALDTAEVSLSGAERAHMVMEQALQMAEQKLDQARADEGRIREGALSNTLISAAEKKDKLHQLHEEQERDEAEHNATSTHVEKEETEHAETREELEARMDKDEKEMKRIQDARTRLQQTMVDINTQMLSATTAEGRAAAMKSLTKAKMDDGTLGMEESIQQDKIETNMIAMKILSDAESETAALKRPVPLLAKDIQKRSMEILAAEASFNQSKLDASSAQELLNGSMAAVERAEDVVANSTSDVETSASELADQVKAVKQAEITKQAAETALASQADAVEMSSQQVAFAAGNVEKAEEQLLTAQDEQREAIERENAAADAVGTERTRVEEIASVLAGEQAELDGQIEELGTFPPAS